LIKFLHKDVSVLWDPKQLYRVTEIHNSQKRYTVQHANCHVS
jgi:hypothetical protein